MGLTGFGKHPVPVTIGVEEMFHLSTSRGVPSFEEFWKADGNDELEKLIAKSGADKRWVRNLIVIPREFVSAVVEKEDWSPLDLLAWTAKFLASMLDASRDDNDLAGDKSGTSEPKDRFSDGEGAPREEGRTDCLAQK